MSWNYRVVRLRRTEPVPAEWFEIRECYYDDAGKIWGYTGEAASPFGDDLDELRGDLGYIAQALNRPVINEEDLPRDDAPTASPTEQQQLAPRPVEETQR